MSSRHASIAILPFENLSGCRDDARMASGFVQDLIAELARFPSIGVIAAESTFAIESTGLDDADIGRRLAVEYLLKGSLRRSARSLRLSAQLVQLATGQHLWAERYDVPHEKLFAVQDEIAAKVANALTARIDQTVLVASRSLGNLRTPVAALRYSMNKPSALTAIARARSRRNLRKPKRQTIQGALSGSNRNASVCLKRCAKPLASAGATAG